MAERGYTQTDGNPMTRTGKLVRYALRWWLAAGACFVGSCTVHPPSAAADELPGWRVGLGLWLFFSALLFVIAGIAGIHEVVQSTREEPTNA